jgi:hypothetical protein
LKLLGRPLDFAKHGINYITSKKIRNIVQELPFDSLKIYVSWPNQWKHNRNFFMNLTYYFTKITGIQRDSYWILRKRQYER